MILPDELARRGAAACARVGLIDALDQFLRVEHHDIPGAAIIGVEFLLGDIEHDVLEEGHRDRAGRPEDRRLGREGIRSEEHTSELQSLMRISYAVFCLKKKKTNEQLNKSINYIVTSTDNV